MNPMLARSAFSLVIMLVSGASTAQPNDDCAQAFDISPTTLSGCADFYATMNFFQSDITTNPPSCVLSGTQIMDFWYRVYSGNNTTLAMTLFGDNGPTVGYGIYSSCGGAEVACDVNVEGQVSFTVNQNSFYFIQIFTMAFSNPSTSANLCVLWTTPPPAAPVNDNCNGAAILTPSITCVPTTGNGMWATSSDVNSSCVGGGDEDDLWYRFTAPLEEVTITVDGGGNSQTGYDPVVQLGLSPGCNGTMSSIFCIDNTGPGGIEVIEAGFLNPGATFYIRVWDWDVALPYPGDFTICVQRAGGTGVSAQDDSEWRIGGSGGQAGYRVQPPEGAGGIAQLRVLDVTGREMKRDRFSAEAPFDLRLDHLLAGQYFLVIEHDGRRLTHRILEH